MLNSYFLSDSYPIGDLEVNNKVDNHSCQDNAKSYSDMYVVWQEVKEQVNVKEKVQEMQFVQ